MERLHEAEETLTTARRLAQKMGNQLLRACCMLAQAQIALLRSSPDQAETLLQAVQPIAEALSLPELETELYRLRSLSEAQRENWHLAALFAEHAVQSANSCGHALPQGLSSLQRALVRKQLGDAFASGWELAESILSECGKPLWWRRAQPPSAEPAAVASDGWALKVRLLGEVSLRFRERQMLPSQWVSSRTRALFAHLVLMQGGPVHTEWIQQERGLYRWTPTHSWVADAFGFERIAQEAFALNETETCAQRLDDALRYYRGDLCPEFAEEPWCQPDFQRLRTLYLEYLLLRRQIASVRGNHREVVDYGERALQLDPCDEASARMLMRAYHTLRRKTDVHQTYVRCQEGTCRDFRDRPLRTHTPALPIAPRYLTPFFSGFPVPYTTLLPSRKEEQR